MTTAAAEGGVQLAVLVREHQAGLWRYLRFLGCEASEADDLLQETFLAVLRNGFEVRTPGKTAAYLRTTARNHLLMARRKAGRKPPEVDLAAAETVWAEMAGRNGLEDYLEALEDCLQTAVTDRVRTALELRYREEVSRAEIAQQLEMAEAGVKTLLRRARTALRECVERKLATP